MVIENATNAISLLVAYHWLLVDLRFRWKGHEVKPADHLSDEYRRGKNIW